MCIRCNTYVYKQNEVSRVVAASSLEGLIYVKRDLIYVKRDQTQNEGARVVSAPSLLTHTHTYTYTLIRHLCIVRSILGQIST
jgi:hypothetical protein